MVKEGEVCIVRLVSTTLFSQFGGRSSDGNLEEGQHFHKHLWGLYYSWILVSVRVTVSLFPLCVFCLSFIIEKTKAKNKDTTVQLGVRSTFSQTSLGLYSPWVLVSVCVSASLFHKYIWFLCVSLSLSFSLYIYIYIYICFFSLSLSRRDTSRDKA